MSDEIKELIRLLMEKIDEGELTLYEYLKEDRKKDLEKEELFSKITEENKHGPELE